MNDMTRRPTMSDLEVNVLASALHRIEGYGDADVEMNCYCRRIATVDETIDGEQSEDWSQKGEIYDPAEWGHTAQHPTACEQAATALLEAIESIKEKEKV